MLLSHALNPVLDIQGFSDFFCFKIYLPNSTINAVEEEKAKKSELSKYVWQLNQNNIPNRITWEVAARARPFQCSNLRCYLCLNEKLAIALAEQGTMLNKRTEIVSKCRHKNKFLLKNVK